MIDEIRRNHQAVPTEEELFWMNVEPVAMVVCLTVLAAVALAISVL